MSDQDMRVDYERVCQENKRLWAENAALRPMVSDLQHRLNVALMHLKHIKEAETAPLIRKDPSDHG